MTEKQKATLIQTVIMLITFGLIIGLAKLMDAYGQTPFNRNVEILKFVDGKMKVIAYQRCEVVQGKEKCTRKGKLRTLGELKKGEFIVSLPYREKVGVVVKELDGEELK